MFKTFMHDEAALLRAARAEWALVPLSYSARGTEPTEEPAILVGETGITIGRHAENQVVCDTPTVRARFWRPAKPIERSTRCTLPCLASTAVSIHA